MIWSGQVRVALKEAKICRSLSKSHNCFSKCVYVSFAFANTISFGFKCHNNTQWTFSLQTAAIQSAYKKLADSHLSVVLDISL